MSSVEYILGHSKREVRRLELQAAIFEEGTERLLRATGLGPGMRVLDIGTGAGDVAMLAGGIVGAAGQVLGIDREVSVLAHARRRADLAGMPHVQFKVATLDALPPTDAFDLVIGRYVLMHQADPVAMVRRAYAAVRPGGTLAFIEAGIHDKNSWSNPKVQALDDVFDLIKPALDSVGSDASIGTKLVALFRRAGVPQPNLLQDVPTGGPGSTIIEWGCLSIESLLPQLQKIGMTSAEEVGIDTLQDRLTVAVADAQSQIQCYNLVGGWIKHAA